MSETPVELIVSAFQSEDGAEKALQQIISAKKEKLVKIHEAAVVVRDGNNKLHISERGDLSPGMGAGSGAALGAAIGLFGGPIGALIGGGVGAAIGGIAAKLIDSGIPNHRLTQIGEALKPGTSALVAMVEHTWVDELQQEFDRAGGDTLAQAVTSDIAKQLGAGREVAYSAVAAAGGTIATRTTQGPEGATLQGIATDGQNFVAGAFEATKDSVKGIVTDGAEVVAGIAEKVEDVASGAVEAASDAAKATGAAASDAASTATDAVSDAAKAAKDAVS
ncbi:MAG: DUF1269 domain-containing protein [Chloroflexales bacterium]|nr:DUF1269 domain-containing protein [Chloroflexales bacterium]